MRPVVPPVPSLSRRPEPDRWVPDVEDPMELYARGLDFAAEVAHAEARWQTELALRATADPDLVAQHRYAAERASKVEAAIRGMAACSRPATAARP